MSRANSCEQVACRRALWRGIIRVFVQSYKRQTRERFTLMSDRRPSFFRRRASERVGCSATEQLAAIFNRLFARTHVFTCRLIRGRSSYIRVLNLPEFVIPKVALVYASLRARLESVTRLYDSPSRLSLFKLCFLSDYKSSQLLPGGQRGENRCATEATRAVDEGSLVVLLRAPPREF